MRVGQVLGRMLFVTFLVFRGVQHIHKPEDWSSQFITNYGAYFNKTSKLDSVVQSIPDKWLNLLHPSHVSIYATQYGGYIGYAELALAACIIFEIPFLPLIFGFFLFLESIIFFNPFNPMLEGEIYYLAVNLAFVGVAYMMAFTPPLLKGSQKNLTQKGPSRSGSMNRNQGFSQRVPWAPVGNGNGRRYGSK